MRFREFLEAEEGPKYAKHVTDAESKAQILGSGRIKPSKTGWLGPGIYAHIRDGTEGKGDEAIYFDYSRLKLCDSGRPPEVPPEKWNIWRVSKGSVEIDKILAKKYGYDGRLYGEWILIYPSSAHKIVPLANI